MPPDASQGDQILTFAAGGRALAIPADAVAEVVAAPRITRVPQSPASLRGLANLRGKVTPILSVDTLLGGQVVSAGSRVIVLKGDNPVGLAVDRVNAMRTIEGRAGDPDASAELVDTADGPVRLLRLEPLLAGAFAGLRSRPAVARDERGEAVEPTPEGVQMAFLQFELAGQAFALPLEQVREVTVVPPEMTTLPQTDVVMAGIMPFRGELLALVSLRALLGFPSTSAAPGSRIVVASLGEATVGLVVDSVRAILRAHEEDVGAVPTVLNRGAGEARIDAIVRTPGGLVSLLAAERIFLEETVAEIIAEGAGRRIASHEQGGETAVEQFVLFCLADETYGLPVASVSEIVRLPETIARVPRAPDFVAGVMNHRGEVVPLIDQRRRFSVTGETATRQQRVIVAQLGDLTAGFIVDAVEQILDVPVEALRATPELAAADTPIFDRITTLDVDGRLVLLVDPRQLLDQAERDIVRDVAHRSNAPTA